MINIFRKNKISYFLMPLFSSIVIFLCFIYKNDVKIILSMGGFFYSALYLFFVLIISVISLDKDKFFLFSLLYYLFFMFCNVFLFGFKICHNIEDLYSNFSGCEFDYIFVLSIMNLYGYICYFLILFPVISSLFIFIPKNKFFVRKNNLFFVFSFVVFINFCMEIFIFFNSSSKDMIYKSSLFSVIMQYLF